MLHMRTTQRVFVPYRGFYFLNKRARKYSVHTFLSSSPIGAFIFLIIPKRSINIDDFLVFVPYRGFYFLNRKIMKTDELKKEREFSSPIGAFIFLINTGKKLRRQQKVFVPYRGFYFLNQIVLPLPATYKFRVFVPYRGFYFLNRVNNNVDRLL